MSYQKYHTNALILRSFPRGDSDRTLVFYTEQFGLIYASARAARAEHSKMRHALTDFALVSISLVRGRSSWRVAGAVSGSVLPRAGGGRGAFARIANLVVRLMPGADGESLLYDTLVAAHRALGEPDADTEALEVLTVLRILHALGYVAPAPDDFYLIRSGAYDREATTAARGSLTRLLRQANEALAESQL